MKTKTYMKVIIFFTMLLFSLSGYGESYAYVTRNNGASNFFTYNEFYFFGVQINKYIELKWSAKNNDGVDYFIIENSVDGINWMFVDCVDGMNNSKIFIDYKYQDYDILRYSTYEAINYRIVHTDFNHIFYEYKPISIKFSPSVSYILNRNSRQVSIYTNDYIGDLLSIYTVFGERIINEKIINEITILDLSKYTGVLLIRVNGIYVDRIVL